MERLYHTGTRHIGGFSAGGYNALRYALLHPELFACVGGHMPSIDDRMEDEYLHYFGIQAKWRASNPLFLAETCNLPSTIEFYLDCGDEDEGKFYRGCARLSQILENKYARVQNHLNKGHHDMMYIKANLEYYLKFYSQSVVKQ